MKYPPTPPTRRTQEVTDISPQKENTSAPSTLLAYDRSPFYQIFPIENNHFPQFMAIATTKRKGISWNQFRETLEPPIDHLFSPCVLLAAEN